MDWQTVINIGLGSVLAALGWFAREIWDSLKELRKDTHQIEKDLRELYVRRDDLKEVRIEMTARFDKLESLIGSLYDRLNDKADKWIMSDIDPIITAAQQATQGIKSAIKSGREISQAVESIQNFGVAELKARQAYKLKNKIKTDEVTIMTAMSEWRRLYRIKQMEDEVKELLCQQFGEDEGRVQFGKVLDLKEKMQNEARTNKQELTDDLKRWRSVQVYAVGMATLLVTLYYIYKGHLWASNKTPYQRS